MHTAPLWIGSLQKDTNACRSQLKDTTTHSASDCGSLQIDASAHCPLQCGSLLNDTHSN